MRFMRMTALGIAPAWWLLAHAGAASASTFAVNPTQVHLSAETPSRVLRLRNDGAEPLRFQLSVSRWEQGPRGEIVLSPTEDVIFFPRLLSLAPREERSVRIGMATSVGTGTVEKTYRLYVQELPPPQATATASPAIRVLTKMGIPIFIEPPRPSRRASIGGLDARLGSVSFQLVNGGTVHLPPQAIRVAGLAEGGSVVWERALQGWYVLAGASSLHEVELSAKECADAVEVVIETETPSSPIRARQPLGVAACAP